MRGVPCSYRSSGCTRSPAGEVAWIITACLVRRLIGGEDEIIARPNPETGQIENLEVLFCTARLLRREWFSVPVTADLRLIPSPAEVAEAAETDRR